MADAVYFYRKAREAWNGIVQRTRTVYVKDLGYGEPQRWRGHWEDRLPAIDQDLSRQAFMERQLKEKAGKGAPRSVSEAASSWLELGPPGASMRTRPAIGVSSRPVAGGQLELT